MEGLNSYLIEKIIGIIGGRIVTNCDYDKSIKRFVLNPNNVFEGDAFFAINSSKYSDKDSSFGFSNDEDGVFGLGGNIDGHDFLSNVIEKKPTLIVVDSYNAISNILLEVPESTTIALVEDTVSALFSLSQEWLKDVSPKKIAITGSIGKTTTFHILSKVLSYKYSVRKLYRIRTTYLGLIMDIITQLRKGDEFLVVEMQMDGIGQIDRLCKVVRPDYSIITFIGDSHLERFKSIADILNEKLALYRNLNRNGFLFYNYDNKELKDYFYSNSDSRLIPYGISDQATIIANNITLFNKFSFLQSEITGLAIKQLIKTSLPGKHFIYSILAAFGIAELSGFDEIELEYAFKLLKPVPSRFQVLEGINQSLVISDSYNASKESVYSGVNYINSLKDFQHKYVVLGSLLELGSKSIHVHSEIGEFLGSMKLTGLVTLGEAAEYTAISASNMKDCHIRDIVSFFSYEDVCSYLETLPVDFNTCFYIKGSGRMRMEIVTLNLLGKNVLN